MRILLVALVLACAPPAAAQVTLDVRTFSRATAPHAPSLSAALTMFSSPPIISYGNGAVFIGTPSWSGINLVSVQAAVDAAPADTPMVRAKDAMGRTDGLAACLVEAFARALLPVLNDARQTPTTVRAAITADQVRTSLKAQIDALGCGG